MHKYLIALVFISQVFAAPTEINVGAYHFPPYAIDKEGEVSGLTRHLVDELNRIQKEYKFKIILTTAKDRYKDFASKKYDLMFFESKVWGWAKYPDMEFSKKILLDGEVFITRALPGKNQSYFKTVKNKSMAAFSGYHYKFAEFNSDEKFLKESFNIQLSKSHLENIRKVKESKVELGIVTYSFFMKFLNDHPSERKNYLVSQVYDQRYILQFAKRKNHLLSPKEFSRILNKALRSKRIKSLFKEYNLN